MSRPTGLPDRPPGLPVRPRGLSPVNGSVDSYRPPASNHHHDLRNQQPHQRSEDMYQFRGNSGSTYEENRPPVQTASHLVSPFPLNFSRPPPFYREVPRPALSREKWNSSLSEATRQKSELSSLRFPYYSGSLGYNLTERQQIRPDYPPQAYNRAPGTFREMSPKPGFWGDSNRPQTENFSFRYEPPPSIDFSRESDTYRPLPSMSINQNNNNGRLPSRNNERRRGARGRGGQQGRGGYWVKTSDRPFLKTNRLPTPERMPGMIEDDGVTGVRFRAVEDLSDSDEADMDLSSDAENTKVATSEPPRKKQARADSGKPIDGDSVPRWSNPDPYTALPPPDESQRKKKDVVKLIRKARVFPTSENTPKAEAAADDFISFDFDDDGDNEAGKTDSGDESGNGVLGAPLGPRGYSHRDNIHAKSSTSTRMQSQKTISIDKLPDPALGNRKRTINDEIKGVPVTKRKNARPAEGAILREWRCPEGTNATPWCTIDHSHTMNMGFWLHKEIMDFYHHVKPTDYEDSMRASLVSKLRGAAELKWQDARVYPFGSFVAGLYLPTADMDLVFVSDRFLSGGRPIYDSKSHLWRFKDFLISRRLAVPDTVECITGAKVPLVKYVDAITGLRVDISFENDTGLIANNTFQDWKKKFPAMPILVTLIKQYLAMRGLNEPVNGGIGGFAVTCLVTSLLQLMPQVQSGNMIPEHHLGEMFMEFLDLYGNEFNTALNAIQLNPPGYLPKSNARSVVYRENNQDRFSIIDPNNSSNDISGGSKNTRTIVRSFSTAFNDLQGRMSELHFTPIDERKGQSILECILGGDYSSFDIQRNHLRRLHERDYMSS